MTKKLTIMQVFEMIRVRMMDFDDMDLEKFWNDNFAELGVLLYSDIGPEHDFILTDEPPIEKRVP